MRRYDPLAAPAPEEWLSLEEGERIRLVDEYHRRARVRLPDGTAHAIFHAVIENQIAAGDEIPVRGTLARLMDEGLDRHEAIHAIGTALSEHIWNLWHQTEPKADPNAPYFAALDRLTAEEWRRSG